MYIIEENY